MSWWTAVFEPVWTASLLPTNATVWERVVEAVDADLVARNPVGLIPASRSDQNAPEQWLAYLAEERSVDEYDGAWPLARRRAVTRDSFAMHRVKGTRPALDRALEPFGYQVSVVEWFERAPAGPAYTFRIRVDLALDEPWLGEQRAQLIRIANQAKNAHTLLEAINPVRQARPASAFVGVMYRRNRRLVVGQQPRPSTVRRTSYVFVGVMRHSVRRLIVGPKQET